MGNTQGEIQSRLLKGFRDSSEIKKQTIIMTEEEVRKEGERIEEKEKEKKKLPRFNLSRKINELQH